MDARRVLTSVSRMGALLCFLLCALYVGVSQTEHSKQDSQAPDRGGHRNDYAELAKVPEKARSRRNPFEGDADAVAGGKKLFEQHCAECHGEAGGGSKKGPRLNVPEVQESTPGALFSVLSNGVVRRGMPVWSKLPEAQRWQLVAYLKTLKMDPPDTEVVAKPESK